MLSPTVVEACKAGQFSVYAVGTIQEALEILTGMRAGARDENGDYPEDSLLFRAVEQAREYWARTRHVPVFEVEEEEEETEASEEAGPKELD